MPSGTVTPGNGLLVATLPISEANVTNLSTDLTALQTGTTGVVRQSTTNLTSAQLKALTTTSVTLLAAPSGRNYYVLHNTVMHYRFVTTPYLENMQNLMIIGYGSTAAAVLSNGITLPLGLSVGTGDLFKQTADAYVGSPATTGTGNALNYIQAAANIEAKALSIAIDTTPLTAGDGTLTVRLFYSIIDGAP